MKVSQAIREMNGGSVGFSWLNKNALPQAFLEWDHHAEGFSFLKGIRADTPLTKHWG